MADAHKQTVVFDLDGTLARYDGWKGVDIIGEPFYGAVDLIRRLLNSGIKVWIYTTRTNTDVNDVQAEGFHCEEGKEAEFLRKIVRDWLKVWGFPLISDNFDVYIGPGKPIASIYVDDKAYMCDPARYGRDLDAFLDVEDAIKAVFDEELSHPSGSSKTEADRTSVPEGSDDKGGPVPPDSIPFGGPDDDSEPKTTQATEGDTDKGEGHEKAVDVDDDIPFGRPDDEAGGGVHPVES